MRRLLPQPQDRERGTTLVEVMTAASIVAILGAVSIPIYLSQQGKAIDTATTLELRKAHTAIITEIIEDPSVSTVDLSDAALSSAERVTITLTSPIENATFCLTANAPDGQTPVMSTDESGFIYDNGTCDA